MRCHLPVPSGLTPANCGHQLCAAGTRVGDEGSRMEPDLFLVGGRSGKACAEPWGAGGASGGGYCGAVVRREGAEGTAQAPPASANRLPGRLPPALLRPRAVVCHACALSCLLHVQGSPWKRTARSGHPCSQCGAVSRCCEPRPRAPAARCATSAPEPWALRVPTPAPSRPAAAD